jgi:hypothetical protein
MRNEEPRLARRVTSLEEFRKVYTPRAAEADWLRSDDPKQIGAEIARRSIEHAAHEHLKTRTTT